MAREAPNGLSMEAMPSNRFLRFVLRKPLTVKVVLVAPATPLPLLRLVNVVPLSVEICHWTASGVVPLSAMVKN